MKKVVNSAWKLVVKLPIVSFIIFLILLFALIFVGNMIRNSQIKEEVAEVVPRAVSVFKQQSSYLPVQAQVQQDGIVQIVALQSGIVDKIQVAEGDQVKKGQRLLNLANNYNGANSASLQARKASLSHENTLANYDNNVQALTLRREQIDLQKDNDEKLHEIKQSSLDDTHAVLNLYDEKLKMIDENISLLEKNASPTSAAEIDVLKTTKASILSSTISMRASIRATGYEIDNDGAARKLQENAYELTLKQLENEARSLELSKQISALDLQLARIGESLMYPSSPFAGEVEQVNVQVGDLVSPGTVLMTITAPTQTSKLVAKVDERLVDSIDSTKQALVAIDGVVTPVNIAHLSSVPTAGTTYNLTLILDENSGLKVSNNAHLEISLPLVDHQDNKILLPIDSVYQTTTQDYVLTANQSGEASYSANLQNITLGKVIGNMVEITSGLNKDGLVILDRGVMAGDQIVIKE